MAQIADSHNFKASTTIAAALVTVHPGGIREMHWHPNADEWQYYVKGSAQMTVFNTGPKAVTNNFSSGDIGYVPANFGHYVKNVGNTRPSCSWRFSKPTRTGTSRFQTGSPTRRQRWSRPTSTCRLKISPSSPTTVRS